MALPILRPALPQLLPSEPCRSEDDQHNAAPAVKPKGDSEARFSSNIAARCSGEPWLAIRALKTSVPQLGASS
jgi:hypothetical protein